MKSQINIRASALLVSQLDELTERLGTSITETVSLAIDRMYIQEIESMNTKQAATRIVRIDSKNERIELRSGAKGTGRVLWSCNYWPDSDRSVEEMDRLLTDYVRSNDIQLMDAEPIE